MAAQAPPASVIWPPPPVAIAAGPNGGPPALAPILTRREPATFLNRYRASPLQPRRFTARDQKSAQYSTLHAAAYRAGSGSVFLTWWDSLSSYQQIAWLQSVRVAGPLAPGSFTPLAEPGPAKPPLGSITGQMERSPRGPQPAAGPPEPVGQQATMVPRNSRLGLLLAARDRFQHWVQRRRGWFTTPGRVNLRYGGLLARGGQGGIWLYNLINVINGRTYQICVKVGGGVEGARSIAKEKTMMRRLRGSKFLVQEFAPFPAFPGADNRTRSGGAAMDAIIMEYAPLGSLNNLLEKMGELTWAAGSLPLVQLVPVAAKKWPNRIIWQIFHDLYRGVMEMRHPPADNKNTHSRRWMSNHLVHFDLDAQNVLMSNFDGDNYMSVPRALLADFGLAKEMGPIMETGAIWSTRQAGKIGWALIPEQFSKEWDFVEWFPQHPARLSRHQVHARNNDLNPQRAALSPPAHPGATPAGVAGQYGWQSNMYQVGWIMWSMLTRLLPPAQLQLSAPLAGGKGSTWEGGYLSELNQALGNYDAQLIEAISTALSDVPGHRRDPAWWDDLFRRKFDATHADYVGADTPQIRAWMDEMIALP